ncbi:MAG TPA: hypothetical protein VIG67_02505 [Yaniella sp.]
MTNRDDRAINNSPNKRDLTGGWRDDFCAASSQVHTAVRRRPWPIRCYEGTLNIGFRRIW